VKDDPGLRMSIQPNPFRRQAVISYTIPRAGDVEVAVYNSIGQKVRTVIQSHQEPGPHVVKYESDNHPVGVYFCRLRSGGDVRTSRMVLMR
jgi:hypothetical protein